MVNKLDNKTRNEIFETGRMCDSLGLETIIQSGCDCILSCYVPVGMTRDELNEIAQWDAKLIEMVENHIAIERKKR